MALDGDERLYRRVGVATSCIIRGYVLLSLSWNQLIRLTSHVRGVLSLRPQYSLYVGPCKVI